MLPFKPKFSSTIPAEGYNIPRNTPSQDINKNKRGSSASTMFANK